MARRCSVLVVEDDPGVADLLEHILASEGNDVAVAANTQTMAERLATGDFDVVVVDIVLPGPGDPMALAKAAAEMGCAVVLITGRHDLEAALVESGHPYLLKPFRVERLLEAIERAGEKANVECVLRHRKGGT